MTNARVDGDSLAGVVLGLDAGTTSAKAVAVDRAGQILATAGSDPIVTRSTPAGASEQDPAEIWRALTTAGRRAVDDLRPGVRVAALAVAAQSGSVIPVPPRGRAERAITWMDTRSRSVVGELAACGRGPDPDSQRLGARIRCWPVDHRLAAGGRFGLPCGRGFGPRGPLGLGG